ncbi:hypothetical protein [Abyssalbus ytuae]|uniref:Uncharacterized protein n=1 Tax=Abyssalbus ytuae TaxID=2926907 RepID=A0A9E6ZKZ3_9FLAO|nr:hypothetical protein [Abyssalbus ytuae]UOB17687.1 hypothetical protein MQE35_18340 [Abyssalbus ytuae]
MKLFKQYLQDLLKSLPLAIITSCISVMILLYVDFFKDFDLFKITMSFLVTVLIMSHLIKPFSKIVARL